jgi:beta-glucanase (GH16 family)
VRPRARGLTSPPADSGPRALPSLAYPITKFYGTTPLGTLGGFGLGGTNATGQVPDIQNRRALIDPDTPQAARSRPALNGGGDMELVFSDEFNTDGRTFYPGDDPFWEAVDLHYWATGNAEWYDPAAVTTGGGSLAITYSANPENGLNYTGGMIQSW